MIPHNVKVPHVVGVEFWLFLTSLIHANSYFNTRTFSIFLTENWMEKGFKMENPLIWHVHNLLELSHGEVFLYIVEMITSSHSWSWQSCMVEAQTSAGVRPIWIFRTIGPSIWEKPNLKKLNFFLGFFLLLWIFIFWKRKQICKFGFFI